MVRRMLRPNESEKVGIVQSTAIFTNGEAAESWFRNSAPTAKCLKISNRRQSL